MVFPKKNFVYESREIIYHLPSEHLLRNKIYNNFLVNKYYLQREGGLI